MTLVGLVPFAVAAGLLTITPGPDTMLVLRNTLRGGHACGIRTTMGICLGLLLHASLLALGLSVVLVRSAGAFYLVKLAGAGYLVWLGVQSLRRSARAGDGIAGADHQPSPSRSPLLEGLLTNALNPKVAVFYLAFLPQFIAPHEPALAKLFLLAGIHNAMGLVWLSVIAMTVDQAQRLMAARAVRRALEAACGAVLVALGLRLALARR